MARCRQRILLSGRMHQRGNIVSYRRKQAHNPFARPNLQDALPIFSGAGSCQRPLKRTLRSPRHGAPEPRHGPFTLCAFGGFPDHGERAVAGYTSCPARRCVKVRYCLSSVQGAACAIAVSVPRFGGFVQILGKLNFFKIGRKFAAYSIRLCGKTRQHSQRDFQACLLGSRGMRQRPPSGMRVTCSFCSE
jgi:hypothetical protein